MRNFHHITHATTHAGNNPYMLISRLQHPSSTPPRSPPRALRTRLRRFWLSRPLVGRSDDRGEDRLAGLLLAEHEDDADAQEDDEDDGDDDAGDGARGECFLRGGHRVVDRLAWDYHRHRHCGSRRVVARYAEGIACWEAAAHRERADVGAR